jgi:hypothetical protein
MLHDVTWYREFQDERESVSAPKPYPNSVPWLEIEPTKSQWREYPDQASKSADFYIRGYRGTLSKSGTYSRRAHRITDEDLIGDLYLVAYESQSRFATDGYSGAQLAGKIYGALLNAHRRYRQHNSHKQVELDEDMISENIDVGRYVDLRNIKSADNKALMIYLACGDLQATADKMDMSVSTVQRKIKNAAKQIYETV